MDKYKTVKEVCAMTGLTRKRLYYFHHENVVRAVAYANYSVEGYDRYKLYDDIAVEKLQQIALYYQLGMKRDEIRDIMMRPPKSIRSITITQFVPNSAQNRQAGHLYIQMRKTGISAGAEIPVLACWWLSSPNPFFKNFILGYAPFRRFLRFPPIVIF